MAEGTGSPGRSQRTTATGFGSSPVGCRTPQEADARQEWPETAQQTLSQLSKNAAAQRSKVTTSRGKMSQAAVSYHISKSKVEANGKGERFNEQKARDYAQANIDKVMAQIDKIAAAGPRS